MRKPYGQVIADSLPTFANCYRVGPHRFPSKAELDEAARVILQALADEGYEITTSTSDRK